MRKTKKVFSLLSTIVFGAFIMNGSSFVSAANTNVAMSINAGVVSIAQPASLTFSSSLNASFSTQTLQQQFTGSANYFNVGDMKGNNSGYNTFLQLSGNLTTGSNSISGAFVLFRAAGGTGAITATSGSANPRVILDAGTAGFQALNTSRTFIRRNTAANFGVVGEYSANVELRVDVPASQPAGAYAGTLVYTVIEN